jgi:hypothetical protein
VFVRRGIGDLATFCASPVDWTNPAALSASFACLPYRGYRFLTNTDYPAPPMPAPPGAPQTVLQMTDPSAWTPEQAAAAGQAKTAAQNQAFFGQLDQTVNPPASVSGWSWLAFGGVVLGVVLVGRVAGGGR